MERDGIVVLDEEEEYDIVYLLLRVLLINWFTIARCSCWEVRTRRMKRKDEKVDKRDEGEAILVILLLCFTLFLSLLPPSLPLPLPLPFPFPLLLPLFNYVAKKPGRKELMMLGS